jgi:hypothetical protein
MVSGQEICDRLFILDACIPVQPDLGSDEVTQSEHTSPTESEHVDPVHTGSVTSALLHDKNIDRVSRSGPTHLCKEDRKTRLTVDEGGIPETVDW